MTKFSITGSRGFIDNSLCKMFLRQARQLGQVVSQLGTLSDNFDAAGPECNFVLSCEPVENSQRHTQLQLDSALKIELHKRHIYTLDRVRECRLLIDRHTYLLYRQPSKFQVGVSGRARVHLASKVSIERVGVVPGSGFRICRWAGLGHLDKLFFLLNSELRRRQSGDRYWLIWPRLGLTVIGRK